MAVFRRHPGLRQRDEAQPEHRHGCKHQKDKPGKAERARLFALLAATPCLRPHPSEANFILVRLRDPDEAQVARSRVIVQTRYPDHPLFGYLARHDYAGFADQQLAERREVGLPPYRYQALLRAEAPALVDALAFLANAKQAGEWLQRGKGPQGLARASADAPPSSVTAAWQTAAASSPDGPGVASRRLRKSTGCWVIGDPHIVCYCRSLPRILRVLSASGEEVKR